MEKNLFQEFCRLIYQRSGITLHEGKEALVTARIAKRLRALDIPSHQEYLRYLKADPSGEEFTHFLDAIATNVTRFFREPEHFSYLRSFLARRLEQGQRRFRFWSAACSTGEEAYTIAMIAASVLGMTGSDWKVLATDLSTQVLKQATQGSFPADAVKEVPPDCRQAYFDANLIGTDRVYQVKPQLRERVVFRQLNLANPPFPMKGPLDAVFCRNVMIYFDLPVRSRLIAAICELVPPKGILFVGLSESLSSIVAPLKNVEPSVYLRL